MTAGEEQRLSALAPYPVSVVLSVHNGQRFLAQALESILQSERPPLEILVIDDGSTDATIEIARKAPLTRVISQPQGGIAKARNHGVSLARGEFIAFNSYDDIWAPEKLDRQVAFMGSNPNIDIAVCMMRHFLEAGSEMPRGFRRELLDKPVPGFIPEAMIARRTVFARIGLFDTSYATSEDTDWFSRAIDAGLEMAVIPDVLLHKRVHGTNTSLAPTTNQTLLRAVRSSILRKRAIKA